jgi:ABC-type glycerol-3-phosphate transport system substrate-binding protein
MRVRAVLLAAALVLSPLAARAADLVVWWEEGRYPGEDGSVEEIVAAFEHRTGKDVELAFHPALDLEAKTLAALAAGRPPDFLFGLDINPYYGQWAYEGRLADLSDAIGPLCYRMKSALCAAQRRIRRIGLSRGAPAVTLGIGWLGRRRGCGVNGRRGDHARAGAP